MGWDIFSFAVGGYAIRREAEGYGVAHAQARWRLQGNPQGGFKDAVGRLWEVEETVRKL